LLLSIPFFIPLLSPPSTLISRGELSQGLLAQRGAQLKQSRENTVMISPQLKKIIGQPSIIELLSDHAPFVSI